MAKELNVEFLGSLPLDPLLARCCDEGKNFLTEVPDSPTVFTLQEIVQSKFIFCKFCTFVCRRIKQCNFLFQKL